MPTSCYLLNILLLHWLDDDIFECVNKYTYFSDLKLLFPVVCLISELDFLQLGHRGNVCHVFVDNDEQCNVEKFLCALM